MPVNVNKGEGSVAKGAVEQVRVPALHVQGAGDRRAERLAAAVVNKVRRADERTRGGRAGQSCIVEEPNRETVAGSGVGECGGEEREGAGHVAVVPKLELK
eukprot:5487728-Prymnesium_polylepis.1